VKKLKILATTERNISRHVTFYYFEFYYSMTAKQEDNQMTGKQKHEE
jgi:hypothetical protein